MMDVSIDLPLPRTPSRRSQLGHSNVELLGVVYQDPDRSDRLRGLLKR